MANRGPSWDPHILTISDLATAASARLPPSTRDYYNLGAMDLQTLSANLSAFTRYKIIPRVLTDVSALSLDHSLFGVPTKVPFGFSPTAMHMLAYHEGEKATSRAAGRMGVPMVLSSYSTVGCEEVIKEAKGNPYAMQMCIVKNRDITLQILRRAEESGYKALFLSVDTPVLGRRLNEFRNNFELPPGTSWPNILSDGKDNSLDHDFDPSLTWDTVIPWLRQHTKMEIWLKGLCSPLDVEKAIHYRVNGIVISNHGGRQLDGVPATLDSLRVCAPMARKGGIKIAMDGGIRRGTDIFKALALGADFVFLGRVAVWGLAYKGEEGVVLGVKILIEELRVTMALAGCKRVEDITREHLAVLDHCGVLSKL